MSSWNDFTQKVGQNMGWISALIGAGVAIWNGISQNNQNKQIMAYNQQEAAKQREFSMTVQKQQQAFDKEMWQATNEYNAPDAELQRYREAGLNPLFYMGSGTGAQTISAPAALGYERASMGQMTNPVSTIFDTAVKAKELEISKKLADAQVDKMHEETGGLKLDNEFKEKTLAAREEGVKLANEATKEQIKKTSQEIEESKKRVNKLIEETKDVIELQGLHAAQAALNRANEKEILELLPYKQNLMSAQTLAQKAAAAASYAHAAYEKGLLDSGYIQKMCDNLEAQAKEHNANVEAKEIANAINEWKLSVKNGNIYDIESIPWSQPTDKIAAYLVNGLFKFASAASEAVGGGLA